MRNFGFCWKRERAISSGRSLSLTEEEKKGSAGMGRFLFNCREFLGEDALGAGRILSAPETEDDWLALDSFGFASIGFHIRVAP